ncbi:juvenile hormone esterase-like isoform X2 [Calliphora vicina]|uniref:juvenile hormone esterase-like isoform X2 n=1 Tax=Calliphora vicina TaxID=7373 RepID=UPI00325B86F5
MIYVKLLSCCLMLSVILDLALKCLCYADDDPKVCTHDAGCYIGTRMDGYQSGEFDAFMGIPYSFPPARFENIVDPLPVMVYIFGGGFFAGSSSPIFVGPEYIMDHGNIILVTFGYRLGAFGFLSTGDDILPGNLGLKDQNMALRWVYSYIGFFGGDRYRVTLFGQSAGAVSAHMHMLSKISQHLFYGIIAISGTANVPFNIDETPEYTFRQTAKYANISNWDTKSTERLAYELQNVHPYVLLNAGDGLKYWDVDNMVNYRPVIEKPGPFAFLDKHPVKSMRSGDYTPVPIMFGRVPKEGGVRVVAIMESDKLRNEFNAHFNDYLRRFLEFPKNFTVSQQIEKVNLVIKEYFDDVRELNNQTREGFMDMVTDRGFYHPLYHAVKMFVNRIDTTKNPLYMYEFNYLGSYTYAHFYAGHVTDYEYGVVHCDDLVYLFRAPRIIPDFDKGSVEAGVIKEYVGDLVHFAQLRRPKVHKKFRECNRDTFYPGEGKICDYHEFINGMDFTSLDIKINDAFDTRRMKFWDDILDPKKHMY